MVAATDENTALARYYRLPLAHQVKKKCHIARQSDDSADIEALGYWRDIAYAQAHMIGFIPWLSPKNAWALHVPKRHEADIGFCCLLIPLQL